MALCPLNLSLVVLFVLFRLHVVAGFVATIRRDWHMDDTMSTRPRRTVLQEQPDEWKGFNPLQRGGSLTRISLRQAKMQELTQRLLAEYSDPAKMMEHKDFVLHPILDLDAPLEEGSIYCGKYTVQERLEAYQVEMTERISLAKTGPVKTVLTTMMEFVAKYGALEKS